MRLQKHLRTSEPIPDGFILREGKGGADAVLSMLTDALEEEVTGHIQAGKSSKAVSLLCFPEVCQLVSTPQALNHLKKQF